MAKKKPLERGFRNEKRKNYFFFFFAVFFLAAFFLAFFFLAIVASLDALVVFVVTNAFSLPMRLYSSIKNFSFSIFFELHTIFFFEEVQ